MLKDWKRCLITSLLAVALVLSVGVPQVDAYVVCHDFTTCIMWEDGWECYEYVICIEINGG